MTARPFHEGQDVEVYDAGSAMAPLDWRKAKIICRQCDVSCDDAEFGMDEQCNSYEVQFPDGSRAIFDAGHIRAVRLRHQDSTDRYLEGITE